MNKAIIMGRLTRDPEIKYTNTDNQLCIARYTIAIDRPRRKDGQEAGTDFISCVAFGKSGEFAEKYLKKGQKIMIEGRIQTGSYTNKEGQKVYTTDIVVENHEFAEGKRGMSEEDKDARDQAALEAAGGFMSVDGIEEDLPFN